MAARDVDASQRSGVGIRPVSISSGGISGQGVGERTMGENQVRDCCMGILFVSSISND